MPLPAKSHENELSSGSNITMKKITTLIILCVLVNILNAQITITNSNMPGSGDTARYSNVSVLDSVDYISTGANYTWDFSNLVPVSQGLYEYKPISQINPIYFAFFGFSAFGQKVMDSLNLGAFTIYDIYDFYSSNSTAFKAVGRGMEIQGFPIPSDYSDHDEIYQFPLNYSDIDNSTYAVSFQLDTLIEYFQTGTRLNEVEGWGTIMTPYDTVSCLKVKTTINEHDSIVVSGFGLPAIDRVKLEYKWLSLTEFVPMLEIKGEEIFGFPVINSIRYRDNYIVGLGMDDLTSESFNLYPNPVSNNTISIQLPMEIKNINYSVYSMNGELVLQKNENLNGTSFNLSVSGMSKGIYLLKLNGEKYSNSQLFIIE